MEGRQPKGILMVLGDLADPAQEQEANHFYHTVHIPDVLGTGTFSRASRFANTLKLIWKDYNPPPSSVQLPQLGHYVTIYETDQDIKEARAKLFTFKLRRSERPYLSNTKIIALKRITNTVPAHSRGARPPTNGLEMVITSVPDPKNLQAYHQWYDSVHIAHLFEGKVPGLVAATRYENIDHKGDPGEPQFFTLYELNGDPDEVYARIGEYMGKRRAAGTTYRFADMYVLYNQNYKRFF